MSRLEIPDDIAQRVTSRLKSKKLTIATAESCTGGWLAQTLTSLPGSSEWFRSGFITYSNDSKQDILNVPSKYLCADGPGAVSEEVVRAMVDGAIAVCKTNLAISISGVAGPDGGTSEKPIGTVWIAWRWESRTQTKRFLFMGGRAEVRLAAVEAALLGILEFISS